MVNTVCPKKEDRVIFRCQKDHFNSVYGLDWREANLEAGGLVRRPVQCCRRERVVVRSRARWES